MSEKRTLTLESAKNIILSRVMAKVGSIKNVEVLNVSFNKKDGSPHDDPNWNEGKPYAVANFNAVNPYYKAEAIRLFAEARNTDDAEERAELLQKATNQHLSQRVSVSLGRKLMEAGSATIVGKMRTWTDSESGDEITSLAIKKSIPNMPEDASENIAFKGTEDVFQLTEAELAGAPN